MQEPCATATDNEIEVSDWAAFSELVLAPQWQGDLSAVRLTVQQRLQISLRLSHGGFGMKCTEVHAAAAYVGRTVVVLEQVLRALPLAHRQRLMADGRLLATRPLQDVQDALQQLRQAGVLSEHLVKALSPSWVEWAEGQGQGLLAALTDNAEADEPEVPQRLQAKLALLTDEQQCKQMDSLIDSKEQGYRKLDRARRRSQASKGAMAWAGAMVTRDPSTSMPAPAHRETCRRSIGLERDRPDGGKCAQCTGAMTSVHARRCGGSLSFRHDRLNDNFAASVKREARVPVMHRETDCCFEVAHRGGEFRMDLVIEGGQMEMPGEDAAAQKGAAIDFAIVDPTANAYLAQAAAKEGAAAAAIALQKRTRYSTPLSATSYNFYPVVFELFGAASEDAHKLVRALAKHQVAASNGTYALSHCVNRWRQRLSVCVQTQVSRGVMYEWTRMVGTPNQPRPDKWAYARRKLLLVPKPAGD